MSESLRIVVAGGGTGGHVYPGIAVVERLQTLVNTQALFVGTRGGVEERILARAGCDHELLPGYGLRRATLGRKIASPFVLAATVARASRVLSAFRPDIVLGTGGYASAAVVVASMMLRIPRVLQEQNSVPGLVNRTLARHANLMLLAYDESRAHLPADTAVRVVGNPLRRMPTPTRAEGAAFFRLDPARPTVLVIGGSRGAHSLNIAGAEAAAQLAPARGVQFVILCGARDRGEVERISAAADLRVRVLDYLDEVHFAYALADVAVARAGASSVFELALFGVPTVFVPYPYAADAHQEHNASPLARTGAAVVVRDGEVAQRLVPELEALIDAPERRRAMSLAMRSWSKPKAADDAADAILELIKKKEHALTERKLAA
jgi:UDP-N-acetylglucosamine--N-acetylmuramyl-(pentapeptide) pyrophosphoryl-undecaprenol N-acetylglucosamine transferase